jgi:hypothetical protein
MTQQQQLSIYSRKQPKPRTQMMSVRQAAIQRRCCLKWIYDLLHAQRLRGARKVGGEWRIPQSSLKKLQASREKRFSRSAKILVKEPQGRV